MPRWQRKYLAVCAAIIGYALFYMLSDFGAWPKLTYFPYERAWEFHSTPPGSVPMAYVGMVLWALVGALATGATTWAITGWGQAIVTDRWLYLAAAWALTAAVLAGCYFTWNLWPF